MRELDRINRITLKLMQLWLLVPDQRFGQLLWNYIYSDGKALYSEEDHKLEKRIDKAMRLLSYQREKEGFGKTAR